MLQKHYIDEVIQKITLVLSTNRCALSEKEKVLLQDCLNTLTDLKKSEQNLTVSDIVNITSTVLQVFFNVKDMI